MELSICQAENGFSLDELVKKFADAFENKALADILKMNLQLTQEVLMHRIFNGKSNQQCCPDGHLTLNGSFERRIRTSLGEFKMDFWRVRCSKCGKTFAPLAKLEKMVSVFTSSPHKVSLQGKNFEGKFFQTKMGQIKTRFVFVSSPMRRFGTKTRLC